MKKLLFLIFIATLAHIEAQTNVSGGIYSNTTWSLANSPYVITGTVVVFPGVTLTIQPGVTVKFDTNQVLEIRQAKLIASGTNTDSITFTANSSSPAKGFYTGIYLNGGSLVPQFNYCKFMYADFAVNTNNINFAYTLSVKNSRIVSNNHGFWCPYLYINIDSCAFNGNSQCLYGDGAVTNCTVVNNTMGIDQPGNPSSVSNCLIKGNQTGIHGTNGPITNCTVSGNQTGIYCVHYSKISNCSISGNGNGILFSALNDTVRNCCIDSNQVGIKLYGGYDCISNCLVTRNGIGIHDSAHTAYSTVFTISNNYIENNQVGMVLGADSDAIYCNRFCANSLYALKYTGLNNTSSPAHNYWCTPDSASTENVVYDGYDNISYGLVLFMPIDSACSHYTTCHASVTDSLFNIAPLTWGIVAHYSPEVTGATWNWGDGSTSTGSYPSHTYSTAGWYHICVTAYTACGDSAVNCIYDSLYRTSASMISINVMSSATGIDNVGDQNQISTYPNPSNGLITLESNVKTFGIEVSDVNGMKILHSAGDATSIDLRGIPDGIYFLRIQTTKGVVNKKLVIAH